MSNHRLLVYEVSTNLRRGTAMTFGDFDDSRTRLSVALVDFLAAKSAAGEELVASDKREASVEVTGASGPHVGHYVDATLELGGYGVSSRIRDMETNQQVFAREDHHLEAQPAIVLFRVPDQAT